MSLDYSPLGKQCYNATIQTLLKFFLQVVVEDLQKCPETMIATSSGSCDDVVEWNS